MSISKMKPIEFRISNSSVGLQAIMKGGSEPVKWSYINSLINKNSLPGQTYVTVKYEDGQEFYQLCSGGMWGVMEHLSDAIGDDLEFYSIED